LKNPLHIYERIDDYLNERLSEAERISFEIKLEEDKALLAKVEETRMTNEAIYYASMAELKLQIGNDIKDIKYSKKNKWSNLFLGLGLSAFVCSVYFIATKINKSYLTKYPEEKISLLEKPPKETSFKERTLEKVSTNVQQLKNAPQPGSKAPNSKPETAPKPETTQPLIPEKMPFVQEKMAVDNPSVPQKVNTGMVLKNESVEKDRSQANQDSVPSLKEIKPIIPAQKLSYSFNPDYNESWELKYEKGASGTYIIYNTIGKEVYRNSFGNGSETWSGMDSNGNILSVGSYIAIVRYSDGKEEKIDLTIVR
jgi:hypothetical protein